jgi:hypothetical protein
MRRSDDLLFSQYGLRAVIENQERKMLEEIDSIDANRLLNTNPEELSAYFEEKYKIAVPQLDQQGIQVDQSETQVDVSQDRNRFFLDRSQPFYVKGTTVTFFVPFQGDKEAFKCRPSTFTLNPPRADIAEGEIAFRYTTTEHKADAIKSAFDRDLAEVRKWLEWITKDVSPFNASVRGKAKQRIETRREKLIKDQGLVSGLGFPLRKRDDAPQTYVVPTVRRKITPVMPKPGTSPFVPEPTLNMQEYEHILSVISNMVMVMERSPKAFSGMNEEDLRQHFLVQLNGQYEGQATGETFNFEGKTDILIRAEGKNIFIAECKFWRGPASLTEAIDQLLGYASWRDTKTALLVFNREKSFSAVLAKIPEVVKAHPNFKRELSYDSETGFRYVLHHRDDKNRELILTILAFEVPA